MAKLLQVYHSDMVELVTYSRRKFDVVCVCVCLYPCSRLKPATRIPPQTSHTETPTHIETRTHDQCGDTIQKSQAPDDGCINVRNMLSVEEVK